MAMKNKYLSSILIHLSPDKRLFRYREIDVLPGVSFFIRQANGDVCA